MPSIDELFDQMEEQGIETYVEEIEYCIIDADTRQISTPLSVQTIGVESDEKTNRLYFQCPKIVGDNVDLIQYQLRINYQNANGEKDQYIVTDVNESGDNITFSWLLSRKVTAYAGDIKFIVCAVKVDDTKITNEWNTTLATITSLQGLEIEDVQPEQNEMDVIAQLMQLVTSTSQQAIQNVGVAEQSAITAIQSQQTTSISAVQSASNNAIDKIEQAGDDILNSIPSTYTELYEMSEETNRIVKQMKAQIDGGEAADEYVVGLEVDYENKTFIRLMGASGKNAGEDFGSFFVFGGRKRCNVDDGGNILAWYGDADYKEDGTNGQVMVYQPKVYYRVVPLKLEKLEDCEGYRGLKVQYYVTDRPLIGFKLHPAFCMAGKEIDYILLSAYEGTLYDVSESSYITDDSQVAVFIEDKLCSVAGSKPISGKAQNLTRANAEQLAKNRGEGWHIDFLQTVSLEQLLEIIEMGMLDIQTAIGPGVTSVQDTSTTDNNSVITGGTSELGNDTGSEEGTTGQVSVTYRGRENVYGNIWKFIEGVNIHGDGTQKGGVLYVCNDFDFTELKNNENYEKVGFCVSNTSGYTEFFGYDKDHDYLFFATDVLSSGSDSPVKDYLYVTQNLNGYRVAHLGGSWNHGASSGLFYWHLGSGVSGRGLGIGCRLVYIP